MSRVVRALMLTALIAALPLPVGAQTSIGSATNPIGPQTPNVASPWSCVPIVVR